MRGGRVARAAVMTGYFEPFLVGPMRMRDPAAGEVLVRTAAAPFCSTDWMGWKAMRRTIPPVVLGHTAVGTVEAVGDGVTRLSPGDRVLVAGTPQCRECYYCRVGRPDQCELLMGGLPYPIVAELPDGREVRAAGLVGAYASQLLAYEHQVHRLPDGLPFDTACLLGCGISSAVGAVENIARVEPGQSVAILGLGHLGLWAVQGARLAGAGEIIGVDGHGGRRALAASMGATNLLDPTAGDPVEAVRALTGGRGADVVIEAAGPEIATRQAVLMARRAGTVVLMGVAHSTSEVVLPQLAMTTQGKAIHGCQNGRVTPDVDFPRWIGYLQDGLLDPAPFITRRYDLSEADEALRRSMSLDDVTGVFALG
ncbi:MAG: zinc-binding dehydrogenase [Microbacteriaceae bacterium]|nr:zinc-binding dehydrogenase [Microbacteriaceae bacterium]